MANTVKVYRGVKSGLPTLAAGVLGFATDTFELFIGTGSANKFIGSPGTGHTQNTDTGTSNSIFQVGTSGVKLKNNAGDLDVRNAADNAFAGIQVGNLQVIAGGDASKFMIGSADGQGTYLKSLAADTLKTISFPNATGKVLLDTSLSPGYLPYHVSDAAGLANSPIYTDGTNVRIGTPTAISTEKFLMYSGNSTFLGSTNDVDNVLIVGNLGATSHPYLIVNTGNAAADYQADNNTGYGNYVLSLGTCDGAGGTFGSLITGGKTVLASITGSVLIGATAALTTEKLRVAGTINVGDGLFYNSVQLVHSDRLTTYAWIWDNDTLNTLAFGVGSIASGNIKALINSTGQFLVGATSAMGSEKLLVSGNVHIGKASQDNVLTIGHLDHGTDTYATYIDLQNEGYGAPGAWQTASKGDKLILWGGDSPDLETRIGVSLSEALWIKAMGTTSVNAFTIYASALNSGSATNVFQVSKSGSVSIGSTTANGKLDVWDGTSTLSSTTVTHGMTGLVATNVYGILNNIATNEGGLSIAGFSDTDYPGLIMNGVIGTATPTATTPSVIIVGRKKGDGLGDPVVYPTTSWMPLAATETVLVVRNSSTDLVTVLGSGSVTFNAGGNTALTIGPTGGVCVGGTTDPGQGYLLATNTVAGTAVSGITYYNNDYTATTRSLLRVRQTVNVGGSTVSAYLGMGVDQYLYLIANDTSRNDLVISSATGHVCMPYGVHIGATLGTDPGDNNLLVDGTLHVDGVATLASVVCEGTTQLGGTDGVILKNSSACLQVRNQYDTYYSSLYASAGMFCGNATSDGSIILKNLENYQGTFRSDALTANVAYDLPNVSGTLLVSGASTAVGAFGCNGATAQTAYASGGALNSSNQSTDGAYGFKDHATRMALVDLVVAMRAALVANGIMS